MSNAEGAQPAYRNIPEASFIEDIHQHCDGKDVIELTRQQRTMYEKYKFMETHLLQQKAGVKSKLPDIKSALQLLELAKEKRGETLETQFQLAETVYAKAKVTPDNSVFLWLGANIMMHYSFDEALALLSKNKAAAEQQLASISADLAFLKEQIITTEVNISRLHNLGVTMRKRLEAEQTAQRA
ncbi:MAG: hypothetical protein MHM6MM_007055 [Cercozoa sp. M6MM]